MTSNSNTAFKNSPTPVISKSKESSTGNPTHNLEEAKKEISKLRKEIESQKETISWYEAKSRELLLTHYTHKKDLDKKEQLAVELHAMTIDRNGVVGELERIKVYSPDSLPKIIGAPLKLLLTLICSGPMHFLRQKKKPRESLELEI